MPTQALTSQKAQLQLGDGGSPEVFTLIPECRNIRGPQATKAEVDVTSLDSDAREFIAGLADFGQLTATMNWRPQDAIHKALRALFVSGAVRNFRLVFADVSTTRLDFAAFVMEFPLSLEVDAPVQADLTLRITGNPTMTP